MVHGNWRSNSSRSSSSGSRRLAVSQYFSRIGAGSAFSVSLSISEIIAPMWSRNACWYSSPPSGSARKNSGTSSTSEFSL